MVPECSSAGKPDRDRARSGWWDFAYVAAGRFNWLRATGKTREETEKKMYEAIQLHLEGLREDGLPIPASESFAEYLVVGA